jgi:glycine cleavage system transcriptional repressor
VRHFALTAVGADRPGIVAGVTGPLVELGCNLEDTSMTILRGRFAMVLVVAGPDDLEDATIAGALAGPADQLGLGVWVHPVGEETSAPPEGETLTVSVHGADRPGIVHRVTSVLAASGANVLDLSTRVVGGEDRPAYVMVLEALLPPGADAGALGRQLSAAADELGVACTVHPSGADLL